MLLHYVLKYDSGLVQFIVIDELCAFNLYWPCGMSGQNVRWCWKLNASGCRFNHGLRDGSVAVAVSIPV